MFNFLFLILISICTLFLVLTYSFLRSTVLDYEIKETNYFTDVYFNIAEIDKSTLRKSFGILQSLKDKKSGTNVVLCMILVQDEGFVYPLSICNSFPLISEKDFIDKILIGMINLKDKEFGYPLDFVTYFIVRIYKFNFIPNPLSCASTKQLGIRVYSTKSNILRPLRERTLNLKRFSVLDIETIQVDNSFIPYAIGICGSKTPKIFYISDYVGKNLSERSKSMMSDFINHLDTLSSNKIILAHNFGRFDGYFLLKSFLEMNIKVDLLVDDRNSIITMKFINQKGSSISFKDSLRILPSSLMELGHIYDVEYQKINFDHDTVTPDIILYSKTFRVKQLEPYLKSDLLSLREIIIKASNYLNDKYNVNLLSSYSTSSLAMIIYRTKFYKSNITILPRSYDKIVRESYYGGIVNIYKPYGKNLYYYDINSLYPKAMLNFMPGKFLGVVKQHDLNERFKKQNFFGFVRAHIEIPKDCKYPFAPYRSDEGNLITPTGKWTGLYFSAELKDFIRRGYKVTPIIGYEHEAIKPFNDYVDHFYKMKMTAKGDQRFMIKLLLNGLYGYFGRKPVNDLVQCVHKDELDDIMRTFGIRQFIELENSQYVIIIRDLFPSSELMKQFRAQISQKDLFQSLDLPKTISNVAIASAVTAYARIHLYSFIEKLEGELYYVDTDSIITDQPLPDHLIGDGIGQMKDELKGVTAKEGS
jgi:hypothetical protein